MKVMPYSEVDWQEVKDKTIVEERLLWQIFGGYPPLVELRSRKPEDVEKIRQEYSRRSLPQERSRSSLEALDERERRVIEFRFGIKDGQPRTQEKTGQEMGCSSTTVRRIEKRALDKLRSVATSRL